MLYATYKAVNNKCPPLHTWISVTIDAFEAIFRAVCQAGLPVYVILSLLPATSTYGEPTICYVLTVRNVLYFSYDGE